MAHLLQAAKRLFLREKDTEVPIHPASPSHSTYFSKPEQVWNLFESFLQKAVAQGILHKVEYYEKAWMLDSSYTDIDFKGLISLLFTQISDQLKIGLTKIPWSGLIGIFLRSDGTPFKQQIKTLNPTPATRRYWTSLLMRFSRIRRIPHNCQCNRHDMPRQQTIELIFNTISF